MFDRRTIQAMPVRQLLQTHASFVATVAQAEDEIAGLRAEIDVLERAITDVEARTGALRGITEMTHAQLISSGYSEETLAQHVAVVNQAIDDVVGGEHQDDHGAGHDGHERQEAHGHHDRGDRQPVAAPPRREAPFEQPRARIPEMQRPAPAAPERPAQRDEDRRGHQAAAETRTAPRTLQAADAGHEGASAANGHGNGLARTMPDPEDIFRQIESEASPAPHFLRRPRERSFESLAEIDGPHEPATSGGFGVAADAFRG